MFNESFISLFTFAAVQNDFSFFDLTLSYSLLYMSKSCSVRVAIKFLINYGILPKSQKTLFWRYLGP
jgi:hypothetical protein